MPPQINTVRVTLTVREAARIAGCGERTIRRGIANGTIPHLRWGRNILIPKESFLRCLEATAMKAIGQGTDAA